MIDKICATVILYNPDENIYDNISSYVHGVSKLIIIDNSEIKNLKLINKLTSQYNNIEYIYKNENLGIATALNIACDRAIELSMEWILTMDQDSKFDNFYKYLDCFSKLNNKNNISLVSANHLSESTYYNCKKSKKDFVITSSSFLNLTHFYDIGKFNEDLFIDEVDHDYCARSKEKNLQIIQFENIKFTHTIGYKKKNTSQHNYIRTYYIVRNSLYMASNYSKYYKEYSYSNIIYNRIYKKIFRVIKKEDQKLKKLFYISLAIVDFIRGKYGKK
jgi:rhamnosyltransferase